MILSCMGCSHDHQLIVWSEFLFLGWHTSNYICINRNPSTVRYQSPDQAWSCAMFKENVLSADPDHNPIFFTFHLLRLRWNWLLCIYFVFVMSTLLPITLTCHHQHLLFNITVHSQSLRMKLPYLEVKCLELLSLLLVNHAHWPRTNSQLLLSTPQILLYHMHFNCHCSNYLLLFSIFQGVLITFIHFIWCFSINPHWLILFQSCSFESYELSRFCHG